MGGRKHIVIIGATSSIAEHCARLWVHDQPVTMTLVGRSAQRLGRVAQDLGVRSPESELETVQARFQDPAAIRTTVDRIARKGRVDTVLIAHGTLPDQPTCQNDTQNCGEALQVNGISPVLYAEAFAKYMISAGQGTIVLISSVAGDRGRKSNYVYGAAKSLVTRYAQGMQHRFAGTAINIVLVKPGPTDTPMTANLKAKGAALAPVEDIAQYIVQGAAKGKPTVYAPGKWFLVMMMLRHLPAFVFNKLDI